MTSQKISDIGEKRLISEFLHPLYNSSDQVEGVGDDCAMLESGDGQLWLFSTDRVPADLISFKLGILDYYGLGIYLARLNISDIAACGGTPRALLLNLGLPENLDYEDFKALCKGFGDTAEKHSCHVLGGDISSSIEISISATSIGTVRKEQVLTRRGAKKGDTIFISRPIGITPAAFAYYLRCNKNDIELTGEEISILNGQFTSIEPLVLLGKTLSASGQCSSCMDNTDGVGQCLLELSNLSRSSFVVKNDWVKVPNLVTKIANNLHEDPLSLAFSAGLDFSLVGTLKGEWSHAQATAQFGPELQIVGYVEDGNGVYLEMNTEIVPLKFTGWNYFIKS
jgi:thiamine-monophosphate kinase